MGRHGEEVRPSQLSEIVGTQIGGRYAGGDRMSGVRVVERDAGRVLSTLREPDRGVLTNAFSSASGSFPTEPGQLAVLFAVLPAGTTTVNLSLGGSQLVLAGLPVG